MEVPSVTPLRSEQHADAQASIRGRGSGWPRELVPLDSTWDFVLVLKRVSPMKLILKGTVTREDTAVAIEHGVDEIVLSSHEGRSDPSGRETIKLVPEVGAGIQGRVPVLLDGGIRRGTDVFRALAVGIGRLHVWGWRRSGKKASKP